MAASKNPRIRLLHIRDEIDAVAAASRSASLADYQNDYMLKRTVERALQIISEAARALPSELLARHPEAPWASIIGIGNVLRHEYQHIDEKRLWEIVTGDLPKLSSVVLAMLKELDG